MSETASFIERGPPLFGRLLGVSSGCSVCVQMALGSGLLSSSSSGGTDGGGSALLLRLFQSAFFDVHLCVG